MPIEQFEHDGFNSPREVEVAVQHRKQVALAAPLRILVKRELFSFSSHQQWVNKAQSWYANCGVSKGFYVTVDANGHVMHMGRCFTSAAYPVTCYELQTNWSAGA